MDQGRTYTTREKHGAIGRDKMTPEYPPDSKTRRGQAVIILVELGIIIWLSVAIYQSKQELKSEKESVVSLEKVIKREAAGRWLSVGEVLAWRNIYAKSLDSHKIFSIEQLGEPSSQNRFMLHWEPSEHTKQRRVYIKLHGNTVVSVQVWPNDNEKLYFVDALQKPQQFDFKMEQTE
jgi:hypothetical protein